MSVVSPTWLSLSGEANYIRSTYIDGFLDVSSSRGVLLRSDVSFGSRLIMSTSNFTGTVTPNSTAATSSSWSNYGITWTCSSSSAIQSDYDAFNPSTAVWHSQFSYTNSGSTASSSNTTSIYNTGSSGAATNYNGEWLQIRSSVLVAMKDFKLTGLAGYPNRNPKSFYIVGSNTGTGTWTPILYGSVTSCSVDQSATVTITELSSSGTISNFYGSIGLNYITYGNIYTQFTYFRICAGSTAGDSTVNIDIWNINFTPSPAITSAITLAPSTTAYGQLNLTGGLTTTQNVGIGITNPGNKLQINCTSSTDQAAAPDTGSNHGLLFKGSKTGSTPYAMALGVDHTTGFGYINCAGNSAQQPLMLQSRGGNVGIGTNNPTHTLHVNGTMRCGNLFSNGISMFTGNPANGTNYGSNNIIEFAPVNSVGVIWNMGNGTISNNFFIYGQNGVTRNNGVTLGYGATAWSNMSDERIKTDIIPVENSLEKLLQIIPVTYRVKTNVDKLLVGFTAQNVGQYFPIVAGFEIGCDDIDDDGNKFSVLGITITDLIPYIVKGMQEQQVLIQSQQVQIQSQQSQIDALVARLAAAGIA